MEISQLLDRPIAYHRVFVKLTGSVKAAVLLSQAVYWQKRAKQEDGWWYKTADDWEEETGLTRREQEKARKDAEGYLDTKLKDIPARLYWKVNEQAIIDALFPQKGETSFDKKVKLDSPKSETINKNTENTTENKHRPLTLFTETFGMIPKKSGTYEGEELAQMIVEACSIVGYEEFEKIVEWSRGQIYKHYHSRVKAILTASKKWEKDAPEITAEPVGQLR